MIPWKKGAGHDCCLLLADSYVDASARDASLTVELAAVRKVEKYSALESTHCFQPIAVESVIPMSIVAYSFLTELGQKMSEVSGDNHDQRISVLIQRCMPSCCMRALPRRTTRINGH